MNPRDFKLNLDNGRLRIRWTETQTTRDLHDGGVKTGDVPCEVELPADITAIAAGLLAPERGMLPTVPSSRHEPAAKPGGRR